MAGAKATARAVLLLLAASALMVTESAGAARGVTRVPLYLDRGAGEMERFPVTFGVPVPRGTLLDVRDTRVVDARGREVPAQIVSSATWGPPDRQKPAGIRWLLVDFQPRLRAGTGNPAYFLEFAKPVTRWKLIPLSVVEDDQQIVVDNGLLKLTFSKQRNTLIERARSYIAGDDRADPGTEFLPPSDQRVSYFVTQDGTRYSTAAPLKDSKCKVTFRGSMRVVIRQEGWFADANGNKMCRAIHRYYIYRDSPVVRVFTTWIITADTDKVQFRDMGFSLPMRLAGTPRATLGLSAKPGMLEAPAPLAIVQDRRHHYLVRQGDKMTGEGERASGWIDLSGSRGGLLLCVRDMAEQFPAALEAKRDRIIVHTFSGESGNNLDFRHAMLRKLWGEQTWQRFENHRMHYKPLLERVSNGLGFAKTHETLLYFHGPMTKDELQRAAATLQRPPLVLASGEWNCASRAFGDFHPHDRKRFPVIEKKLSDAFDEYLEVVSNLRPHYGYYDHGRGVPQQLTKHKDDKGRPYWTYSGYRRGTDICNYAQPIAPWILYLRSGDRRYYDYAVAMTRYATDVRTVHWTNPEFRPLRKKGFFYGGAATWSFDGGYFGWTFNNFQKYLLLDYYVTGDTRPFDTAKMILDAFCDDEGDQGTSLSSGRPKWPGDLALMYRATWNERYKRAWRAYEENLMKQGVRWERVLWREYWLNESLELPGLRPAFLNLAKQYARRGLDEGIFNFEKADFHYTWNPFMYQLGYRLTGDPRYRGYAKACVERMRKQRLSFLDCYGLATARDIPAFLSLAAKPGGEDFAVPREATIFNMADTPVLFHHASGKETQLSARSFPVPYFLSDFLPYGRLRVFAPDAKEITEAVVAEADVGTSLERMHVTVGREMPTGTYRLEVEYSEKVRLYPWKPYGRLRLYYPPTTRWVLSVPRGGHYMQERVWFRVPANTKSFTLRTTDFSPHPERVKLISENGDIVMAKQPVWQTPVQAAEADAVYTLVAQGGAVRYVKLEGVPPFIALDKDALFDPEVKMDVAPEPATPPDAGPFVPGASEGNGPDRAVRLRGTRLISLPTGSVRERAVREFFDARQGTVEFFVKQNLNPHASGINGLPIYLGFAEGHPVELPDYPWLMFFDFKNVVVIYDGKGTNRSERIFSGGRFGPDFFGVGPIALGQGRWRHVAIQWTWNDGWEWPGGKGKIMVRAYLDGVPCLQDPSNTKHKYWANAVPAPPPGEEWLIGKVGYDFSLDEFRVSDVLRYDFSKRFNPPKKPFEMDDNTLALFHFNGDLSGTGRGGKAIEGAWRQR